MAAQHPRPSRSKATTRWLPDAIITVTAETEEQAQRLALALQPAIAAFQDDEIKRVVFGIGQCGARAFADEVRHRMSADGTDDIPVIPGDPPAPSE